ncbi:MAG: hypothetical protein KBB64_02920 [Bacteroidia bacterium]|nr:hypothetical protein [Bacteroidia bacterium]
MFKVISFVPGTENTRRTKSLKTRNYDEAVKEAIRFHKEVKQQTNQELMQTEIELPDKRTIHIATKVSRPTLMIQVIAKFVAHLRGENVPAHLRVDRSEEYLKDVERHFERMVACLTKNDIETDSFFIEQVNDDVVGKLYSFLIQEQKYSNRTFNKAIGYYSSLFRWYTEEYNIPLRNPFDKIRRKKTNHSPQAITKEQFEQILNQITPENGIRRYKNGIKKTRNVYRPWLKDAFQLALFSGRRREEITSMKFTDIIEEKDGVFLIQVEDIKVNRIQKRHEPEEKKYNYVPVTPQLMDLLIEELSWKENKNKDSYILAPEITHNRVKSMVGPLSRGFSHFADQVAPDANLNFGSLRKTYISQMQVFSNGNAKSITGHSSDTILQNHYVDPIVIAKTARNFSVFNDNPEREQELEQARNRQAEHSNNKSKDR